MGQQDVRESSTFWFTLIEFEPVYQVCCVAAVNQGDDRMVGQRFREALTAEKGRLLAEPNFVCMVCTWLKGDRAASASADIEWQGEPAVLA